MRKNFEYYVEPPKDAESETMYHFVNGGGGAYLSIGTVMAKSGSRPTKEYAFYPSYDPLVKKIEEFPDSVFTMTHISAVMAFILFQSKISINRKFKPELLGISIEYDKAGRLTKRHIAHKGKMGHHKDAYHKIIAAS